jgi:hypothetical protein
MQLNRRSAAVMAVLALFLFAMHARKQRAIRRRYPPSDFDVAEVGYEAWAPAHRPRSEARRY